jgi:hypothetical protein
MATVLRLSEGREDAICLRTRTYQISTGQKVDHNRYNTSGSSVVIRVDLLIRWADQITIVSSVPDLAQTTPAKAYPC